MGKRLNLGTGPCDLSGSDLARLLFSNKNTKDWGCVCRYPHVREGLRDTIQWLRQVGWIR